MEVKIDFDKESVESLKVLIKFIEEMIRLKGGSSTEQAVNTEVAEGFSAMFSNDDNEHNERDNDNSNFSDGVELY